jgi:hypothetical protein
MIKVLQDHSEIYFMMEKAETLFTDFSIDHVAAFDREDDFCLVVYTASQRCFLCFVAEDSRQQTDVLAGLIEKVQEYGEEGKWKEEALRIIEHRLHSNDNSRFFFDAH